MIQKLCDLPRRNKVKQGVAKIKFNKYLPSRFRSAAMFWSSTSNIDNREDAQIDMEVSASFYRPQSCWGCPIFCFRCKMISHHPTWNLRERASYRIEKHIPVISLLRRTHRCTWPLIEPFVKQLAGWSHHSRTWLWVILLSLFHLSIVPSGLERFGCWAIGRPDGRQSQILWTLLPWAGDGNNSIIEVEIAIPWYVIRADQAELPISRSCEYWSESTRDNKQTCFQSPIVLTFLQKFI